MSNPVVFDAGSAKRIESVVRYVEGKMGVQGQGGRSNPRLVGNSDGEPGAFCVFVVSATEVKVKGGSLIHVYNDVALAVADSSALAVEDGDYVWLERTGDNVWAFANGAEFPADKLSILLATCEVDEIDGITLDYENGWSGGDMIIPEIFTVDLVSDGGSGGNIDTPCDWTYTATTPGGIEISTAMIPAAARMVNVEYSEGTKGICRITTGGSFELLLVLDEVPVPVEALIMVAVSKDGDCYTVEPHRAKLLGYDAAVTEPEA